MQPDATIAVAGKVELGTAAEVLAGTALGGTGAALVVTPNILLGTGVSVTTSAGAADANKFPRLDGAGLLDNTFMTYDATEAEIDQALDGISANVTAANLNILNAGAASDASLLHTHTSSTISLTTLEAVTAANAVALLPNQVQWYSQLTETAIALGDANARRRYSVRFTPTSTVDTFTDLNIRARIVGVGQNMAVRIETDNAGAASGTLADADATDTITAAEMGAAFATELATWAGNVSLVMGTTYHLVLQVSSTDAANYVELSVNSSHDENYVTYTRQTYDLDTATWGAAVTNATPFFWGNTENVPFGAGVVPTDANFGGRTWNFLGFARTTVAANAAVDVYYDIVPGLTLTRGATYYLSTTAGAITTTKPNPLYGQDFAYKIGNALADGTTLKINTGSKKIPYLESTFLSATTTIQFIFWFRPLMVEFHAFGSLGATVGPSTSHGFYDGTNNNSVRIYDNTGDRSTAGCFITQDGTGTMTGVGSAPTDIGFTLTITEANIGDVCYTMMAEGA